MKVEICEGVDQIQTVISNFPKPLIKVDNPPVVLIALFCPPPRFTENKVSH